MSRASGPLTPPPIWSLSLCLVTRWLCFSHHCATTGQQVSVMEDELDRRGVPRPIASPPLPAAIGSGVAPDSSSTGKMSNVSRVITTTMDGGVITVTTPQPKGGGDGGAGAGAEEGAGSEMRGDGPLLSPRGRGYLARLVLEVCAELEESKSKKVHNVHGEGMDDDDGVLSSDGSVLLPDWPGLYTCTT